MIKEIFIDTFSDGIIGWILGILAWTISTIIIGLIGWGLFYLVDSTFLPTHVDVGTVTNKWHTPAHSTVVYVQTGKILVPVINNVPDMWALNIDIDGLTDTFNVSEYDYTTISIGTKFQCEYITGRISSGIYINSITNLN